LTCSKQCRNARERRVTKYYRSTIDGKLTNYRCRMMKHWKNEGESRLREEFAKTIVKATIIGQILKEKYGRRAKPC
jgi:hypothetical protein